LRHHHPQRKPPGIELAETTKAYNTRVNRIRVAAERGIAHLKTGRSSNSATAAGCPSSPRHYATSPDWRSTACTD